MNILIIIDSSLPPNHKIISDIKSDDRAFLFPLTTNNEIIQDITKRLNERDVRSEIINSTLLINENSDLLRERYIKFIGELPHKVNYRGQGLLEWFKNNDDSSLWWFSKVCEKGTFESDTFNCLVQLDTIINTIKSNGIQKILLPKINGKIRESLKDYASENHIIFETMKIKDNKSLKTRFINARGFLYFKHIILLIYCIKTFLIRTLKVKKSIKDIKRRQAGIDPILIITPFPSVDIDLANQGIFKNKFFIHIKEAIDESGIDIIWCAQQILHHNMTFTETMNIGKSLIKSGNIIYFIEEFNSISLQIKAFFRTIIVGVRFLMIQRSIRSAHMINGYNFYGILRDDFYTSFVGGICYQGFLYHALYQRLFIKAGAKKGIYIFEQNMWEKIMLSACSASCQTKMRGYLQGTISPLLLKYFNHSKEIDYNGRYSLPKPHMIICDGEHPARLLKSCGWSDSMVKVAEATRYNYLKGYMNVPFKSKKNIVLIALSIGVLENAALISTAYLAFKNMTEIDIRLKPHPFTDLDEALRLAGISKENLPFKIIGGTIADALSDAKILIAGETGVAVESIAFGCRVVIINSCQWINLSSLRGIDSHLIKMVNSPEQLYQVVNDGLIEDCDLERDKLEAIRILRDFFCLDYGTDYPTRFMSYLDI